MLGIGFLQRRRSLGLTLPLLMSCLPALGRAQDHVELAKKTLNPGLVAMVLADIRTPCRVLVLRPGT